MIRRLNWEVVLLATPAMVLVLGLFVGPMLQILLLSLTEPTVGLQNYAPVVQDPGIHMILWTTFYICLGTSVLCVILGYIVAYAMVHATETTRSVMFFFILVPLWVSGLVRAFAWLMVLRRDGLVNSFVQWLGLTHQPLPISFNVFAVFVGMVHYMLPYAILPLYSNMRDIDGRLTRAARGLGATPNYVFRHVFFPLSLPGVLGAATLVFIMSLGFYIIPLLLSGGRVTMIAEFIAANVLDAGNWASPQCLPLF